MSLLARDAIPDGSRESRDRLAAIACALHLTSAGAVARGAYGAAAVTALARRLEAWLAGAGSEHDAQARRLLLALTCEKAEPGTRPDRILAMVKDLHAYVTRPGSRQAGRRNGDSTAT